MSILTEALERILIWLKQNAPSSASSLRPGLAYSEIENRVEELLFLLPNEFYDLYQWRNGVYYGEEDFNFFCPGYSFNSLEEALIQYEELLDSAEKLAEELWLDPAEIWNPNWFPIFSYDRDYLFIIGEAEHHKPLSPVMGCFRGNSGPDLMYSSITNMMLTVAECYDTGVYYLDEDNYVIINYAQEELVREKYR
jgi:cell wall assembly regulator SMI1